MDGQQPYPVGASDHCQALAVGQLVAAPVQVGNRFVDRAAGKRAQDRHQLAHVGQRLLPAAQRRPRGLEAGQPQRPLDDGVRRLQRHRLAQLSEHRRGVGAAPPGVAGDIVGRLGQYPQPASIRGVAGQQRPVIEHEQRRAQHADQRDVVVRLGQPCQQVGQVAHLLAREEAGAGRRDVGHAVALQGLLEGVHVGEPAHQDGHVARDRRPLAPAGPVPHGGAAAEQGGDLARHRVRLHAPAVRVTVAAAS